MPESTRSTLIEQALSPYAGQPFASALKLLLEAEVGELTPALVTSRAALAEQVWARALGAAWAYSERQQRLAGFD